MRARPASDLLFRSCLEPRYIARPCTKETGELFPPPLSLLARGRASRRRRLHQSLLPSIVSSMPSAPAAVKPEPPSPSPSGKFLRPRSPLANGSPAGEFELRHWRTPKRAPEARWVPPVIEIPHGGSDEDSSSSGGGGGRHGYTSLRDILSSPEYAAAGSPAACGGIGGGGCGSCGDIHMIRHPLVKHAAYAYLQMTPSAREDPARRSRRWRGPLCRLLFGCLSFIGALFQP